MDGATLPAAPSRVTLSFDEPVRLIPGAVQVISNSGARVDREVRQRSGNTAVELDLPPDLPRGSYTATWRLMSADGHEVSGSVSFGVQQAPDAPPEVRPVVSSSVASDVSRGLTYAGLVLCVGVLAAARLVWGWALTLRRTRVLAGIGWLLLAAATVMDAVTTGPDGRLYVQAVLLALLAAAVVNPRALDSLRERYRAWQDRLDRDGVPAEVAATIRFAVDGLWLADTLDLAPARGAARQRMIGELRALLAR